MAAKVEKATLGGGCFWCIDAGFKLLDGVHKVESGYAGGKVKNPTYREVSSGLTGHAEVVQITFDPAIISYEKLLEVFFTVHDPTTPNRQGGDMGTQYRSIILCDSDEQLEISKKVVEELTKAQVFKQPVITQIQRLTDFYPAENYHQNYYENNPDQPYCTFVVKPKINKRKRVFHNLLA